MADIKFDAGFESSTVQGSATLIYKDEDAYKKGTEIPFTQLKAVDGYRADFIEAATEEATKVAEKELKNDKSLNDVTVEFPFSTSKRGKVAVKVERSHTFKIPNAEPGKPDSVTKSTVTVAVKDPANKMSKTRIKELEEGLTSALLK